VSYVEPTVVALKKEDKFD